MSSLLVTGINANNYSHLCSKCRSRVHCGGTLRAFQGCFDRVPPPALASVGFQDHNPKMESNEVASEITASSAAPAASNGELHYTVDKFGYRHRHDSRGRFAKQDGTIDPIVANRLEGRHLLPRVDQRSLPYQRYKAIVSQMAVEQGGIESLTAARTQLIKRFAAASILAEQLEVRIARGEPVSISEHSQLSSTLVRLAQRLGLDRISRDVTPTLAELLRDEPP
jgi:hypothetical protein